MQEVTCPQCESSVSITPDASACSVCGTDLREFISPEAAAGYFYERASGMATSGRRQQALTEVNRGLTYADMSELRLLGAILSKQVGDFAQMRAHVAAIPVDDALRSEGEWLLRSHQSKQGNSRAVAGTLPASLQDEETVEATNSVRQRSSLPIILAIIILLVLAFVWFRSVPAVNEDGTGERGEDVVAIATSAETSSDTSPQSEGQESPTDAATAVEEPTPRAEAAGEDAVAETTEDAADETSFTPEPPPTPEEPTPEPTEAPTLTPDLQANGPVDMQAFFKDQGYLGLALLDVEGELVEGVLQLTGDVPSANELTTIVELADAIEGVDAVESGEITINPPLTYTISVGDNLWTISVYFYGDVEHMNDIFRLNREALGSPEFLPVGAVIELPRFEEE